MDKAEITPALVTRLVARQFPQWADLVVSRVEQDGWDNTTFRLGTTMSVRLPSGKMYVSQVDKEHRWLPVLRTCLPLPIPEPLARGEPDLGFPHPWSVYGWIEGETATGGNIDDLERFAGDLAALHRCDATGGPGAGKHSHGRGGPVSSWDGQIRYALDRLGGGIDTVGTTEVWEAAVGAGWERPPVWVHGDVAGTNLLVRGARLSAVIDFGCCATGDPACDTVIAWTFFSGESRDAFKSQLPVDEATWARGRGWALWKALLELLADLSDPGHAERAAIRQGWRFGPHQIVDTLIAEHRSAL
ncbi:MAG TPA: aminoglycoside phosphotransferase family protein [Acidimicrobiales bacterium]|nr:aminoglycoside phosphotransferase family protein [Acidimicrobiales bacterium]